MYARVYMYTRAALAEKVPDNARDVLLSRVASSARRSPGGIVWSGDSPVSLAPTRVPSSLRPPRARENVFESRRVAAAVVGRVFLELRETWRKHFGGLGFPSGSGRERKSAEVPYRDVGGSGAQVYGSSLKFLDVEKLFILV